MMTRQDLERLGHKVRGTYRGPLGWLHCQELYDNLQQAMLPDGVTPTFTPGSLRVVSQGEGYNVIYILTEEEYQRDRAHDKRVAER